MPKKAKADLDDGYTRIANSIMQALYTLPISNREMRVLLFILYQTYGYNHKERELSNSYIGKGIGIDAKHASKIVQKLTAAKIIKRQNASGREPQKLAVNTHLSEWITTPETGGRTIPETRDTQTGDITIPQTGDRTIPAPGGQYNTDKYNTDKYKTESGGNSVSPSHFPNFDRLWSEWQYSRLGKDKVPKRIKAEIEKIDYIRMNDARLRYEDYFENLTTRNNQPLSARTWFTEAYREYLPTVDKNGIWYNIKGQKCYGEVVFE